MFEIKLKLTLKSHFTTILDGWVGGWICLRIKLNSAWVEVELSWVELRLSLAKIYDYCKGLKKEVLEGFDFECYQKKKHSQEICIKIIPQIILIKGKWPTQLDKWNFCSLFFNVFSHFKTFKEEKMDKIEIWISIVDY